MNMPGFTAGASLYKTSERYQLASNWLEGPGGQPVIPQQDFVPLPRIGIFSCTPCMYGQQVCCPPPGFGLACFIRRCTRIVPL
jgi:hypothetical protein